MRPIWYEFPKEEKLYAEQNVSLEFLEIKLSRSCMSW